MWKETTQHERNMRIWQEEFESFVPPEVLDFHVHVFNADSCHPGQDFNSAGAPITQYTCDELRQDLAACYPGRKCRAVCFGLPFPEYRIQENNRYLGSEVDRKEFFALRLLDPAEDPADVRREVDEYTFAGFKPYPNFVGKADVGSVEIHEMLPGPMMEIADELGLLVMLHIPRKQRLSDPLNQKQIVELAEAWPRAKIVLAHIGRAYYLDNVVGYLDDIKDLPNVYFDLAMLNNWEVIEYTFNEVAAEKLLYGTDMPISLAAGKSVEINNQYTYITPNPWELSVHDSRDALVYTSFLYEELRAIRKAVQRAGKTDAFVEKLFYQNGMALLEPFIEGA